ncbi:unnamed protein product [Ambrosiozyma monospora]|uniref:Unnamed protein product n=1 Tax=Ambrosiozyma monospora TaxID=43982 RepID=A0A9W7DFD3_AMBMO|nr:unnamed protein product [Ambrosiozyma monospora]
MAAPIAIADSTASQTTTAESQVATDASTALAEASSPSESLDPQMKGFGSFLKGLGSTVGSIGGSIVGALLPSSSSQQSSAAAAPAAAAPEVSVVTVDAANTGISPDLIAAIASILALEEANTASVMVATNALATSAIRDVKPVETSAISVVETSSTSVVGPVETPVISSVKPSASSVTETSVTETFATDVAETAAKEFAYASDFSSTSLPVQTSLSFDDLTDVQQKKIANLGSLFTKVVSNMSDALSLGNGVLSLINNAFTTLKNFESTKTTTSATATTTGTPVGVQLQAVNYAVADPEESLLAPQIASALMYAMSVASASATPSSEAGQLKRRYAASASYAAQSAYATGFANSTSPASATVADNLDQFDPQVKSLGSLFGKVISLLGPELGVTGVSINAISSAIGLLNAFKSSNSKEVVASFVGKEIATATISGAPSVTSIDVAPLIASAVSSAMAVASATATATASA